MAQIIICAGISFATPMRPVGAFQIANVLRSYGYTVQVIDNWPHIARHGPETVKQVLGHFVKKNTLWVGFSSTWFSRLPRFDKPINGISPMESYRNIDNLLDNTYIFEPQELDDIKGYVNSIAPDCKFVLGGARAPLGRLGKRKGFIDVYIEGYADSTAVQVTKFLEGDNPFLPYVKNSDGSISITHDHKASTFDYNNNKFTWHPNDMVRQGEALPMEIARGCIFNCSFCAYPLNGRRKLDYLKDPGILREQFTENYERFGTTHYWLLDDTFNDSPLKLEILYNEVFSKLPFKDKLNFNAFMRLDLLAAHTSTIDLLKESGCGGMSFGIESLTYESVKSIGKGITKEKVVATLETLREKIPNLLVDSQFIVGLPYETKETARDWILEITKKEFPLDNAKIHLLSMRPFKTLTNVWTSEFESNPEKYGYTFQDSSPFTWVNNMGFSLTDAANLMNELEEQVAEKAMDAWMAYAGWKNMGLSDDAARDKILTNRTTRIHEDSELRKAYTTNYINDLLKLDPQE